VIKSIREKSGARINVANEAIPGTQDQQVSIWGTAEQTQTALTMIETILATAPADSVTTSTVAPAPGDVTQTFSIAKDIVKRIIGPAGATIQKVREMSGAKVKVGNDPIPGTDTQPLTLTGTDTQVAVALAMVNEIASNPAAPGATGTPTSSVGKTEGKHAIPSSLVGRVIGHGGETIKLIRDQSGAKIHLANEPTPGTDEHALTITGSTAEVQMAAALINVELANGGSSLQLPVVAPLPPQPPAMYAQPGYAPPPMYYPQAPPGFMMVPIPQGAPADPSYAHLYQPGASPYGGAYQ